MDIALLVPCGILLVGSLLVLWVLDRQEHNNKEDIDQK